MDDLSDDELAGAFEPQYDAGHVGAAAAQAGEEDEEENEITEDPSDPERRFW